MPPNVLAASPTTLIVSLAVPASLLVTLGAMYFLGFSLNVVTLLSLSLVVGILVDDAIVEIENIMRHLRMGKTPYQAAMEAADEIGLAVIATSFTLIAVFLPTAFMSGVPGKFFVQFGWAAAISVFFSLVVARMLTPMMAAYLLHKPRKEHRQPRWLTIYLGWAQWCLKHRVATMLAAAAFFFGSFGLVPLLPTGFIPPDDLSQTQVYLSLPPGADRNGDGKPDQALPMVLYVHGGPWARDNYGYSSIHQWLANRGYAVLSVNYRGSTGFGKAFLNAATREFAGKMHDDLIDAVNWAVKEGIAQREKVAIMGGSYGGYATLVGVTFTPDVFACGVDIVGPSNLVTLIESFPPYWGPMLELSWYPRVGDPRKEADRKDLLARSPITRVDQIRKPLLIGQGANDPRVTQRESDQIVAAMKAKSIPVTYALYPDEGHGFARPENRTSLSAISGGRPAKCLGGRYEPVGGDLAGSSLEVLDVPDCVPGLKEAAAGRM